MDSAISQFHIPPQINTTFFFLFTEGKITEISVTRLFNSSIDVIPNPRLT